MQFMSVNLQYPPMPNLSSVYTVFSGMGTRYCWSHLCHSDRFPRHRVLQEDIFLYIEEAHCFLAGMIKELNTEFEAHSYSSRSAWYSEANEEF